MSAELNLHVGDVLLMQPLAGAVEKRYRAQLLGFMPEHSLIVMPPEDNDGIVMVRKGDRYAVRSFDGDRAQAFTCVVMHVCTHPYRYMHISYPKEVQEVLVRKGKRVQLGQPAQVRCGQPPGDAIAMTLVDMSTTGAMLLGPAGAGKPGDPVSVEVSLPFTGMPDQTITLPGVIKTVVPDVARTEPTVSHYGLQFPDLPPITAITIRAAVYERLMEGGPKA